MLFEETTLSGAFIITLQLIQDERGFFMRSFCKKELEKFGLQSTFVQCNISYNHKKGTRRGLHYQAFPHEEIKIVSCRRGAIYDVIVDIRKTSATYGKWFGIELSAQNNRALYVPVGFAHGFQTLCDDVEVSYFMGNYYYPEAARGIRCDDPQLAVIWPASENNIMSENDKNLPRFISCNQYL